MQFGIIMTVEQEVKFNVMVFHELQFVLLPLKECITFISCLNHNFGVRICKCFPHGLICYNHIYPEYPLHMHQQDCNSSQKLRYNSTLLQVYTTLGFSWLE